MIQTKTGRKQAKNGGAAKEEACKEAEDKAKTDFAATEAKLIKLQGERQTERIGAQIKAWKAEGKVLPAEVSGLAEFMANLEDADSGFTFSASDGIRTSGAASRGSRWRASPSTTPWAAGSTEPSGGS